MNLIGHDSIEAFFNASFYPSLIINCATKENVKMLTALIVCKETIFKIFMERLYSGSDIALIRTDPDLDGVWSVLVRLLILCRINI